MLRIHPNRRYLADEAGKTVWLIGDTAWELFAKYFSKAETGIKQALIDKYWPAE